MVTTLTCDYQFFWFFTWSFTSPTCVPVPLFKLHCTLNLSS